MSRMIYRSSTCRQAICRHPGIGCTMPMAAHAPAAPRLVSRPRLFAQLDQKAPVTLLCAPAGSGKTTLLSSWLATSHPHAAVAWVEVERDEEDATRFWGAVMEALRRSQAIP